MKEFKPHIGIKNFSRFSEKQPTLIKDWNSLLIFLSPNAGLQLIHKFFPPVGLLDAIPEKYRHSLHWWQQ